MPESITVQEAGQLKIEVEPSGNSLTLRPIGWINEDVNFASILKLLSEFGQEVRALCFDLGRVTQINSCGIREWLLFMERVQNRIPCSFLLVNEVFIEQANIVPNLLGKTGTPVFAFHAPYFCAKCNTRITVELKSNALDIESGSFTAPPFKCQKCSSALEFDAIEEEYFAFLRHSKAKG